MDLITFCRALPKIELHAHLNGSLSASTLLKLKRYHADSGIADKTDVFCDKFQIGAGDTRSFSDCFQVFSIAHSLTTTPEALKIATVETLKEFQDDGCCYIELRSTPRETPHMTRRQYINTIIQVLLMSSDHQTMVSRLIVSIDRKSTPAIVNETVDLAIEFHKHYPDIVVGIDLSGDESIGRFQDFAPSFNRARAEGLKVTLHCGEVCHPEEVLAMLRFKPNRVGHAVFVHPSLGGTDETWAALRDQKIPVEVCLTSNVNTKSLPDYESHHFRELYQDGVPVIICTDDKGVFSTSLSQEYMICAETFNLSRSEIARLSLNACQYAFHENIRKKLNDQVLNFINKNSL